MEALPLVGVGVGVGVEVLLSARGLRLEGVFAAFLGLTTSSSSSVMARIINYL